MISLMALLLERETEKKETPSSAKIARPDRVTPEEAGFAHCRDHLLPRPSRTGDIVLYFFQKRHYKKLSNRECAVRVSWKSGCGRTSAVSDRSENQRDEHSMKGSVGCRTSEVRNITIPFPSGGRFRFASEVPILISRTNVPTPGRFSIRFCAQNFSRRCRSAG